MDGWRAPSPDTLYVVHGDDGAPEGLMTYADMLDGISAELVPKDEGDYDTLMWAFGAELVSGHECD